jgi:hypothetical protein
VARYDEQVARALAGAHNAARVAHSTPDYVRVGAGLGSAFVWALLDLADAIRGGSGTPSGGPPARVDDSQP